MLKKSIHFLLLLTFFFFSGVYGEINYPADPSDFEEEAFGPVESTDESEEEIHVTHVKPEVKHVGKASTDGMSAAKAKQIQNIALAAGIVAVAVTTLVLVNNHHGHKNSHRENHD